ncbi:hypothetical protein ACSHWB_38345 [Lentzea sp. HUAS TT2]|uniref:hypothetical protein n=1 Tax=Lentzea sp. HUAS TT2 TaxID=3447454 RepID=UPI003F70F49D
MPRLVSSTWGPESLYGRQPDLVRRLRAELRLDEYAVAVALHPNTWSARSPDRSAAGSTRARDRA